MRNFTNEPLVIKVEAETNIDFNISAYWVDGIQLMDIDRQIAFTDTIAMTRIDSLTALIRLPARSTSLINMPYKWRSNNYTFTVEKDNESAVLMQDIKYKIVSKSGKQHEKPVAFKNQLLYFDFK